MSFGGRIKRGPMAADVFEQQFTQIYNGLFRDVRISFKAKGIFGLISTHRDGFGISLEALAACSTDGIAGVRTGLQELIAFNYLQRDRSRDELGRLGESVYFITDMPDGLVILMNPGWDVPEVQAGRSEPKCDSPTLAEPTLDDRSDKKTTSKSTISKKTLSPPQLPQQRRPELPPTPNDEREISATPANDRTLTAAQRAIRTTGAVSETEEAAFITWITQTHKPRGPAWWRTATADLPELAAAWRTKQTPAAPTTRLRPAGQPCACCGTQAPAACTSNGRPYCANCTAPCQSCQQAVPEDQLHTGQCLTCLPIERRTRAA